MQTQMMSRIRLNASRKTHNCFNDVKGFRLTYSRRYNLKRIWRWCQMQLQFVQTKSNVCFTPLVVTRKEIHFSIRPLGATVELPLTGSMLLSEYGRIAGPRRSRGLCCRGCGRCWGGNGTNAGWRRHPRLSLTLIHLWGGPSPGRVIVVSQR